MKSAISLDWVICTSAVVMLMSLLVGYWLALVENGQVGRY